MRIYVVGPVSSGKTTLAKKLSVKLNITYRSLDEIVHVKDKSSPWGNRKREAEERDELFQDIIRQPDWIIEDVGRTCFEEGFRLADTIVLLDFPTNIRTYRIIKRWVRQRLGLEKCIYRPGYLMLKSMFKWSRNYDSGEDKLKERIHRFKGKVTVLRSSKDINAFLGMLINL